MSDKYREPPASDRSAVEETPSRKSEPGAQSENVHGLLDTVLERLHYTYIVKDLTTFREEFRYIFSETRGLRSLPLIWRLRGVEANMVTSDASESRLVYLPSARVRSLTQGILLDLLMRCLDKLPADIERPPQSVFDKIVRVADFDATPTIATEAQKALAGIKGIDHSSSEFTRLGRLITKLGGNYIPFVWVGTATAGEYTYIEQAVDTLEVRGRNRRRSRRAQEQGRRVYGWREMLKFLATGSIHFDVLLPWAAFENPPWRQTNSLHFRVIMPAGLEVDSVSEVGRAGIFDGTQFIDNSKWDGGLFYAYLTLESAKHALDKKRRIHTAFSVARANFLSYGSPKRRRQEKSLRPLKVIRDFFDLIWKAILARDSDAPRVRISATPVPGVRALLALLWVVTGLAYFYSLTSTLGEASYIGWLSALLLVVLSTVVYGIEKPFSRAPIIAQSIAATAVLIELLALHALIGR